MKQKENQMPKKHARKTSKRTVLQPQFRICGFRIDNLQRTAHHVFARIDPRDLHRVGCDADGGGRTIN